MAPSNRNILLIGAIVIVTSIGYYMQWRTKCVVPSCPPCPQAAEPAQPTLPAPAALPEVTASSTPTTEPAVKIITTEKEFNQLIAAHDKPVAFKIYAPWCGPCKGMKPLFEKAAQEFKDKITFVEINQDAFDNVNLLNISSIPAIICYKNGQEVTRIIGERTYQALKQELTALIAA